MTSRFTLCDITVDSDPSDAVRQLFAQFFDAPRSLRARLISSFARTDAVYLFPLDLRNLCQGTQTLTWPEGKREKESLLPTGTKGENESRRLLTQIRRSGLLPPPRLRRAIQDFPSNLGGELPVLPPRSAISRSLPPRGRGEHDKHEYELQLGQIARVHERGVDEQA